MESGITKLVKSVAEEAVQLTVDDIIAFLKEKGQESGALAIADAYKKERVTKLAGQVGAVAPETPAATAGKRTAKKKKGDEQTTTVDLLKEEAYVM